MGSLTRKYLVVGLGKTGEVLLSFLLNSGGTCVAFDELSEDRIHELKKVFSGKSVEFYFADLPSKVLEKCDSVFVSPGVPLTGQWFQEVTKREIPVVGELELASRNLKGSLLAVTGTNGKSTTVSLIDAILKSGGKSSSLKGNIGSPLLSAVEEPPQDFYVVEVSSYQLETIDTFHPKIAIVLNVSPDHLERYDSFDEYAKAKAKISMNQTSQDFFIYNADDPYCLRMARVADGQKIPLSLVNSQSEGGFVEREELVIRLGGKEDRYPLKQCLLKGLHNQENMLAAILATTLLGIKRDDVLKTLENFKGLPHRLERVAEFEGIQFFDDSKGTNVGSVVMSLASFDKNIILIMGGRDKGGDYSPLKSLIANKAKAVIVLGEARSKIVNALEKVKPIFEVNTMKEAVLKSFEIAQRGDTVLLSPACSSFDQYKDYVARGDDFKEWVFHYGKKEKRKG